LGDRPAFFIKEISSMKKLLATLLLSLGVATAAQAQSSVTIYGILDVGYQGKNLKGSPATATNTLNSNQFGSSAETSSRLGFRGTEDLGGGTSAFFTIETGLAPTSSTLSSFNNRQSFVGLAQKGLGNMAIGMQNSPIHKAVLSSDPGQANNVIGSVIYPAAGTDGGQSVGDAAYTIRFANALTATTERFKGFSANALYSLNNQNSTQTGATTGGQVDATAYGLGADYTRGNLYATVAYQNVKSVNDTSATASVSSSFVGTNTTDNQLYAGATYDLKIVKLFAGYTDRKIQSNLNSANQLNRTAQQIGARGFITSKVEGWASIGNGKYNAFGTNQGTANFTAYQLGSNYWLSKRTNLYAIAGSTQTSSTSTSGALSGNMYATGVRHTF
jgi:predicted porin